MIESVSDGRSRALLLTKHSFPASSAIMDVDGGKGFSETRTWSSHFYRNKTSFLRNRVAKQNYSKQLGK